MDNETTAPAPDPAENLRRGTEAATLKRAILDNLFYVAGRDQHSATPLDYFTAVAHTVRDRIMSRWLRTQAAYTQSDVRVVCYLSVEYLLGRHLTNYLLDLDLQDSMRQALREMGLSLDEIVQQEEEPGLGNGGLGRLAACYMDSLSMLDVPAIGYGIRYEFGIFDQEIHDGWQVEISDKWLRWGNPWEIRRPESAVLVGFGGHTEVWTGPEGGRRVRWIPQYVVNGVPYDTPIPGYRSNTANNLRLWASEAPESFRLDRFNLGDYEGAVAEKVFSENISKVLYPDDHEARGKQLRLEQQYFFVSCSLQDMIRMHLRKGQTIRDFHHKWAIQLNDTHPSLGVPELMRLLMDEYALGWDEAWETTRQTFGYTNHTLLPEALERWPLSLFAHFLPRHLEIIFEINRRFLEDVRSRYPGDEGKAARLSLIDESGERYVRMAHLACVGSRTINGVAELHTELLKRDVLREFYEIWPEKFVNVTNGVTPRRWLALSNEGLSALITSRLGDEWVRQLDDLKRLETYANDTGFRQEWQKEQQAVKNRLAGYILEKTGIVVDPASLFDVQVKRIHEYKRQHLNILHIVTLYARLKQNRNLEIVPRTFLFGGKAAPGYYMAKLIIKLINSVAEVVNNDPDVDGRLKVVFLPDYSVSLGQRIYPAADLSEQISTAGKEASGTGNMKFGMNGALTIGTLDGANIEIRDEVGHENFFLFGLTSEEVVATKARGYRPSDYYDSNPALRDTIDRIASGHFSRGDCELFRPLVNSLIHSDEYLLFADYQSYIDCQNRVSEAYRNREQWSRMSILNTARAGKFSSDRAVEEYCRTIWKVEGRKFAIAQGG